MSVYGFGRGHLDNSQLIKNSTKATLIVIY
jgi:hypothetical protein